MTMTAQQKADRLALIKKIAEKKKRQAAFAAKLKAQGSVVRRWTDEVEAPRRAKAQKAYDQEIEKMDEDEKLDFAFHDMEMLYKSRCVDVPLTSNVKVTEVEKKTPEKPEGKE